MAFMQRAAALVLAAIPLVPGLALAQGGGGPGCTNLPEYNRALGALQGMTSACDMSVEEARRVLAGRSGVVAPREAVPVEVEPAPRVRPHRRHRRVHRRRHD